MRASVDKSAVGSFNNLFEAAAFVAVYRFNPGLYSSPQSNKWLDFKLKAKKAQTAYKQHWVNTRINEKLASEERIEEARVLAMAAASDKQDE